MSAVGNVAQKGIRGVHHEVKALTGEDKLVTLPLFTIRCSVPLEVAHVGRTPIRLFQDNPKATGLYYEIRVDNVKDGATLGLAVGVSSVCHEGDEVKLSAMKPSFTAGFDGLLQAEDSWSEINWSPSHLRTGDRVGVLVTQGGDFIVLENGEVRINEPVGIPVGKAMGEEMFALVMASQGVEVSMLDVEPPPLQLPYYGVVQPR